MRIRVSHVGLNFQDVLVASGAYPARAPDELGLGIDCAGVVDAVGDGVDDVAVGDEVVGLATMTMATHVVTSAQLVARKPARLTMAEAATLPGAFLTALHSLVELARVRTGEQVLIHSATGGVGLAAMQVALWRGARVLGTAGSVEKRSLLPMLGASHVADSRSLRFVQEFRAASDGRGVDVILNSLAGAAIPANLELLAPYGRYIELSKRDFHENSPIGLGTLMGNVSFSSVDVVHMIRHEPERAGALLRQVVDLVDQGVLSPLPHHEFPVTEAAAAFRFMAQARQIGKVLLAFGPEAAPSTAAPVVRAEATYLVTGGLGGLGAKVAGWLVDEGARHLLLTGRTPLPERTTWDTLPTDAPRAVEVAMVRGLEACGVRVEYAAVDVADHARMAELLAGRAAVGHPPVRGVLHLAGVIDCRPVRDLDPVDLDTGLRAKINGAWTLHRLLDGQEIDFFVLFSSAAALLSSPLLGAYAAGNAFLDALAHHRRDAGRCATVIDWGYWDRPGMTSRPDRADGRGRERPHGVGSSRPQRAWPS